MKTILRAIFMLVLAGLTISAQAAGDLIRVTQNTSGTISAVLTGSASPCAGSVIFPIGVASVTLTGNEYDISSSFAILDPPLCPSPPQTYNVSATLGTVPDGHYTVVWTIGTLTVRGMFDVAAGVLQGVPVTKLERLTPSRNIVAAGTAAPLTFVIRALDVNGNAVAGAMIMVGMPAFQPSGPTLSDEFGFKGFNIPREGMVYCAQGLPMTAFLATTGADGIASITPPLTPLPQTGSGFPVVARWVNAPCDGTVPPVQAYFPTVVFGSPSVGNPSVVVEYFNLGLGHFFSTLSQDEIDKLDAGVFSGWAQSTGAYAAYASKADAPPDAVPVCRFWSPQYSSHFYSADPAECDIVAQRWPDVWTLETHDAYYIFVPDKVTGECGSGRQPIYRMYNNLPIPNHRYITDRNLREWMTGAGWLAEGYGPESVMMCAPS